VLAYAAWPGSEPMFRLDGKIGFSWPVPDLICAVLLAALALHTSGCTHTKPTSADKPLAALKAKRPPRPLPEPAESDDDVSADYHGTSVLRQNLPLAGTKWEWEGDLNTGGFKGLDEGPAFSVEFKPDGWFDFRADCRRGAGIYEAKGDHIALAVIKSIHSGCHREAQAIDFERNLQAARTFRVDDGKLFFAIKREDKTMVFHLMP
jgi:heat shock protein HslJ